MDRWSLRLMHEKPAQSPLLDEQLLSALIETQSDVAAVEMDLSMVMRIIADRAQTLVRADGAAVEQLEDDQMTYRAASGSLAQHVGLRIWIILQSLRTLRDDGPDHLLPGQRNRPAD